MLKVLRAIVQHPLNSRSRFRAVARFLRWQITSRLHGRSLIVPFVNDARLVVHRGMTGATGNIYMGLHEFADMAFLLHALRPDDLFVDAGANVGSYTVLAGACVGAKVLSVEPIPQTFDALLDNIHLNRIESRVDARNVGLGSEPGTLTFIADRDTVNRVATPEDEAAAAKLVEVPVHRLDDLLDGREPSIIKIDVEGYESQVIAGAADALQSSSLRAIIMETNQAGLRYGMDQNDLLTQLREQGFAPCDYHPFERRLDIRSVESRSEQSGRRAVNTLLVRAVDEIGERIASAPAFQVRDLMI